MRMDRKGRDGNVAQCPDQTGRLAIVTGANGGIGFQIAEALAGAGAEVIVAARNANKGDVAVARIKNTYPRSTVRFALLDLASLASVNQFVKAIEREYRCVDILINNAGVMALPKRGVTADGFEMQLGVNYLSHFALTVGLLPMLKQSAWSRVVTLSSVVHKAGDLDFTDLQWQRRRYSPTGAYHDSKLANLMFAFELQRRSNAAGWGVHSIAAHPGIARTDLMSNGPGTGGVTGLLFSAIIKPFFSHSAQQGALPALFAATSLLAKDGGYYGPTGRFELVGPSGTAKIAAKALDEDRQRQLWDLSEALTQIHLGR